MELTTITTLIGTVGFPIAVCIGLFWFINKTLKDLTTALNNNNIALSKLIEKFPDKSLKEDK